jgi:hypothetical protein
LVAAAQPLPRLKLVPAPQPDKWVGTSNRAKLLIPLNNLLKEIPLANNYFISYDLIAPGQHYSKVISAIEALGAWGKVELSFYYVSSTLSIEEIDKRVWAVMTPNDKLIVIDASNTKFICHNILPEVVKQMQDNWNR